MLCLVKAKGCKRCGGDLSLECDIYGVYAECIQCGANWNEQVMEIPVVEDASDQKVIIEKRIPLSADR